MLLPGHPGRNCPLPPRVTRARSERFFRVRDVIRARRRSRDPPKASAPRVPCTAPGPPRYRHGTARCPRSCSPASRRRELSRPSPGPLLVPVQLPPNRRSAGTALGRSPEQSIKGVRKHLQLYWRRYRARPGAAGRDPTTAPRRWGGSSLLHARHGPVPALLGPLSHLPPLALQPKGQSGVTARDRADSLGAAAVPGSGRGPAGSVHTYLRIRFLRHCRGRRAAGE